MESIKSLPLHELFHRPAIPFRSLPAVLLVILAGFTASARELPVSDPAAAGMDADRLRQIQPLVEAAIAKQEIPGCVVLLTRQGRCIYRQAFGNRRLEPARTPMTIDTVFDMASITKPVATATSIMLLVERGQLKLSDKIAKHIPEFDQNGKQDITVFQCLTHQAGFVPDSPLSEYEIEEKIWPNLFRLGTEYEPGTKFVYSDVGFQILGKLVERVSGMTLDQFTKQNIFEPLAMNDTGFLPPDSLRPRIAPTEQRDGEWMMGDVHDPRSFAMGRVAGHAGLFSTAADLATYGQMMLGQGTLGGTKLMSPATVRAMTAAYPSGQHLRGLGWDKLSKYSSNRGELFTSSAFGHGGFTGTVLWIDPGLELVMVVLSNRVHPDGKGTVNALAGRIANIAAAAVVHPAPKKRLATRDLFINDGETLCGIDVLERDSFAPLEGRRVGLIMNHTALNRSGTPTSELLHAAPNVNLVCLFSPEHGIAGALDQGNIADATDTVTGLPIYSLYGKRRIPAAEQLKQVDTLVFDIQDIGTRFYTYISTMGNAMKVAADAGLRFVVLDRPNPIGGIEVDGPVLDDGLESFVGFHALPLRHGMTVGELARMFCGELKLDLDLEVIQVENWDRAWHWDRTGLEWVNPSPNMRTPNQAVLYPGIGLLETTNLSVGRGTDTPFELIGAPWIDARQLAARLNRTSLAGIRCVPISFKPTSSKFADERCYGVRFLITDRKLFQPVSFGLEVACALRELHREQWETMRLPRLLCDDRTLAMIESGANTRKILAGYQAELADFMIRRDAFLIYD